MNTSLRSLEWLLCTLRFIKDNFLIIFGLGLIAAIGRAIQLRAFGPISPFSHMLLEIMIESARVALFFYALGLANIKSGLSRIVRVVSIKESRRQNWRVAILKLRKQWSIIFINLVAFLTIAYLFNLLIDQIAYETCLHITLIARRLISGQSSVWALILFFKNVSVIPLTLVFQALFLLWVTNRLPNSQTPSTGSHR